MGFLRTILNEVIRHPSVIPGANTYTSRWEPVKQPTFVKPTLFQREFRIFKNYAKIRNPELKNLQKGANNLDATVNKIVSYASSILVDAITTSDFKEGETKFYAAIEDLTSEVYSKGRLSDKDRIHLDNQLRKCALYTYISFQDIMARAGKGEDLKLKELKLKAAIYIHQTLNTKIQGDNNTRYFDIPTEEDILEHLDKRLDIGKAAKSKLIFLRKLVENSTVHVPDKYPLSTAAATASPETKIGYYPIDIQTSTTNPDGVETESQASSFTSTQVSEEPRD